MREARAGDRYLLCSDGLSDPVSHETILEALKIPDVAESADRLIELALRGGGPDNVTVVVADVVDYDYAGQTQPILAGAVSGDGDQVIAPPNTSAGRASAFNPKQAVVPKPVVAEAESLVKRPRSWRRFIIAAVLLIVLVVAGLVVGRMIIRNNYFVAAHGNTVSIMRGVQGSLLGYPLQEPYLVGCLNARNELSLMGVGESHASCNLLRVSDLRPSERAQVIAGLPTGSYDEAYKQIQNLVPGSLLPVCAPPAPPPPPPAPTTSEATTTTTAPAPSGEPGPTEPPTSPEPAPPPTPRTTTPTVTALPSLPPEPGTTCRTAA
jgi:PPM family protein phosphatase